MINKEVIMEATISLIEEKGEHLDEITVREICNRAGVGLGLVNYHFGNKDKLIEQCLDRIINNIVEHFQNTRDKMEGITPIEKLEYLGNVTLDFLFKHDKVSKISVLTDIHKKNDNDNTYRTFEVYLPLVAECRPDWDETTLRRKTFYLVTAMQYIFLQCEMVSSMLNTDLKDKENRRILFAHILHDFLEL